MKINIWIYLNQRTNPGRIHRILPVTQQFDENGKEIPQPEMAVVVAEIVRESAADGHEEVQLKKLEAVHLSPGWEDPKKQWGPNGEWLGAKGTAFIYEGEYPDEDPHEVFRKLESIRQAGPPNGVGEVVQAVDEQTGEVTNQTVPPSPQTTKHEDSEHLPDGFPGKAKLEAEGVKTFGKVRKRISNGTLEDISGIGPDTAKAIVDAIS